MGTNASLHMDSLGQQSPHKGKAFACRQGPDSQPRCRARGARLGSRLLPLGSGRGQGVPTAPQE